MAKGNNMQDKQTIGFIGTGMLGAPMVENLLADGFQLRIYNRDREKCAPLVAAGAQAVEQAWEVAEPAGLVLSCVSDDTALDAVIGPEGELARRLGSGGVHVSLSTILPRTAGRLARQQTDFNGYYVAAPVMGRPDAVRARKQTYFLAGPVEGKNRALPVLKRLGARVFDFGPDPAQANVAKLGANFLIAATIESVAEAAAFVEKNGGDPKTLMNALTQTIFACPVYQNYGRQILDGAFSPPLFKLPLGLKDIRLIKTTAAEAAVPMRFAEVLESRFLAALAHGRGEQDWTAIAAEVRAEAGLD
jgi:3-hydroxyisobutyrate dehydrogenase-like beta-hydroxyacid dehydrogenase